MLETLLPFLFTCVIIELTPGPNMGYLAVLSASKGRRAGFAAVAGVALGLLSIGLAAALGVAAVIAASPFWFQVLRWGGVLYMLYLAWESWRPDAGFENLSAHEEDAKYFRRGFITNVLNPKAAVFYVAVLPTFIVQGALVGAQAVALTLVYVAVATAIHAVIVLISGSMQVFLNKPIYRERTRKGFAIVLAGISIWLFWKTNS